MKRVINILLVAALVSPVFISGCCPDGGYDKMSENYGSK